MPPFQCSGFAPLSEKVIFNFFLSSFEIQIIHIAAMYPQTIICSQRGGRWTGTKQKWIQGRCKRSPLDTAQSHPLRRDEHCIQFEMGRGGGNSCPNRNRCRIPRPRAPQSSLLGAKRAVFRSITRARNAFRTGVS